MYWSNIVLGYLYFYTRTYFVYFVHHCSMEGETFVPNTGEPSGVHANTSEETWKTSRCLLAKKKKL